MEPVPHFLRFIVPALALLSISERLKESKKKRPFRKPRFGAFLSIPPHESTGANHRQIPAGSDKLQRFHPVHRDRFLQQKMLPIGKCPQCELSRSSRKQKAGKSAQGVMPASIPQTGSAVHN
jgi:hypothetical protein